MKIPLAPETAVVDAYVKLRFVPERAVVEPYMMLRLVADAAVDDEYGVCSPVEKYPLPATDRAKRLDGVLVATPTVPVLLTMR